MDKEQTKELLLSLRIIIIGIFFWVIKPRYLTFVFFEKSNFFNKFGFEIIGTILVLIGVFIIFRSYPFSYSMISSIYIVFIFIINILDLFFYDNNFYIRFHEYSSFFLSIMLVFLSKLMKDGLRHFGSTELARKWSSFAMLILFGFSLPSYIFLTLKNLGFLTISSIQINGTVFINLLPIFIFVLLSMIYYLYYLVKSYSYLSNIQKKYNKKIKSETT